MKRTIIILSLLLVASVVSAADKIPAQYFCKADPDLADEVKVCNDLRSAFERTGYIAFGAEDGVAHFRILVLPTVRDGYASITVASSFLYPPLHGLALSAATSGYLILPGGLTEDNMNLIAVDTMRHVFIWIVDSKEIFSRDETRPTLETSK